MDHRERKIFADALDVSPDARAAFVARAAEGDSQLEGRVRRLLDAHDEADGTRGAGPTGQLFAPPEQIGPYKIIEPLGEGGMGTVYLAEQVHPVRRRVALKIIKLGMDTRTVTARFEHERQAMALMSHPHIASIFDAGATEDGRPYFVMEYVPGRPITDYCDETRMTLEARLTLFLEVCRGVRHAHESGMLHRDLKPTNILVAEEHGRPLAKVIDFGIAKAIGNAPGDGAVQTEHGAIVGTPEYMSPEQVDRRDTLDARSDVYALGVILYELLVGTRPIQFERDAGVASIVRAIQHTEPSLPSAVIATLTGMAAEVVAAARRLSAGELRRQLRGDLDAIVLKTLEKTQTRRYASVEELALDIERYLAREPVRARRASVVYRATRFVRRHRLAVSAAGVVFGTLHTGLLTTAWQARVARTERDRAEAALERSRGVSSFMIDLFAAVEVGQNSEPVREVLRRGAERIERLAGQPVAQAEMLDALGRAYFNMGEYHDAHRQLVRAVAIRDSLYPDGHPDLARTWYTLGRTYRARTLFDSARVVLDQALELSRQQFGERHPFVAEVLLEVGLQARAQGRYVDAEAYMLESLALWREVAGEDEPRLVEPMSALAGLMRLKADFAAADAYFREAIGHRRRTMGPGDPGVADLMLHYGDHILEDLREPERAIPYFRDALAQQEEIFGSEHIALVHGLNSLGFALAETGDPDEAVRLARRGLEILTGVYGEEHISAGRQREQVANVLNRVGRYGEAERLFRAVLAEKGEILGGGVSAVSTLRGLTEALIGMRRYPEAEVVAREELALRAQLFGADSPLLAPTTRMLALVYLGWGRYETADSLLHHGLTQASTLADGHPDLLATYDMLVDLYERTGRREETERYRALAAAGRMP